MSVLYKSYPSVNCIETNLPSMNNRKGTFQQLEQLMGIGFERIHIEKIVGLFDWDDEENYEISNLKGVNTRDTLTEKKYRHICYLTESVYALAISEMFNISSNPGFEWQLRYYGKAV